MDKPLSKKLIYYDYHDIKRYLCNKYGFDMDNRKSYRSKDSFWLKVICEYDIYNGSYITLYEDIFEDKSDYIKEIGKKLIEEFGDDICIYVRW